MEKYTLFVDAKEFWPAFYQDALKAEKEVNIQTLSFEGDSAGLEVEKLFQKIKPDVQKNLIIDSYTHHIINDKVLYTPGARKNTEAIRQMFNSTGVNAGIAN